MIIRLRDCASQLWKNGLGRTRELVIKPDNASADDFVWRVSVAEVDSAAPFSRFVGIQRHIALLDGAGFVITLDGGRTHALTTAFEPFAFAGEADVAVTLAGGATRDFNLMVRRSRADGELAVWREPRSHEPDSTIALVFCAQGRIDTSSGALLAGDAWLPTSRHRQPITLHDDSVALVVRIEPLAQDSQELSPILG